MTTFTLVVTLIGISGAIVLLLVGSLARKAARAVASARQRRVHPRARAALVALSDGREVDVPKRLEGAVTQLARDALGTVRGEAGAELSAFLRDRGVVEHAIARLGRPGAVGRARAVSVLGALRAPEAHGPLVVALSDRSSNVRDAACRALARLGGQDAARELLAALERGDLAAGQVAMALVTISAHSIGPAEEALDHAHATTRYVAVQLLGQLRALSASPRLEAALARETDPGVRTEIAVALGRIGSPTSLPALLAATDDAESEPLRAAAASSLGPVAGADAIERLRRMVHENGYEVPHAAARSLAMRLDGRAALVAMIAAGGLAAAHAAEALAFGDVAERARRSSAGRGAPAL